MASSDSCDVEPDEDQNSFQYPGKDTIESMFANQQDRLASKRFARSIKDTQGAPSGVDPPWRWINYSEGWLSSTKVE